MTQEWRKHILRSSYCINGTHWGCRGTRGHRRKNEPRKACNCWCHAQPERVEAQHGS